MTVPEAQEGQQGEPDPQMESRLASSEPFPIVGIGASAGGLAAFEAFFAGMPAGEAPAMAFVLVQHLAPDHKSLLAELIRRYTRMRVFEVEDGMRVLPGCAYIIPPGRDMAFVNGCLQLLEPAEPRGQRLPIDFFFQSLAQDQHERAIGIVLSGTGSDGTLGVRAIKNEGGMVMAQSPASTEFDGMPRSAIATGLVDYQLAPAEMPAQLIAYTAHSFGRTQQPTFTPTDQTEAALKKVFVLLGASTGHDFSLYKPSTILRRIERRLAVNQIDDLDAYVRFLQRNSAEVAALFRDLLIGVTHFFRDSGAFEVLEKEVLPKIFAGLSPGSAIRVWSAACSTGEEAYSLAILLQEQMEALKQHFAVQIFASDIDSAAIAIARGGLYPATIAADLTAERLARFFVAEPGGNSYRIHKSIRDLLVFSEQDVIQDPPFSRLDLICCRNLLIYLGADLQKKVIPLFHYALKPGGFLFLGSSEGIGEFFDLFSVIDRKAKIYQRQESFAGPQRAALSRYPSLFPSHDLTAQRPPSRLPATAQKNLRELTEETLLRHLAPAAVLVDSKGDLLYVHGRTGLFLEPAPGEAGSSNILKMAREGLRTHLSAALHQAASSGEVAYCRDQRVKTNGHFATVNLQVVPIDHPVLPPPAALFLVIFEAETETAAADPAAALSTASPVATVPDAEARIAALQEELRAQGEFLSRANQELESSSEELRSANEEMQSINEELQSTNEELETSKEELQSVNEELATVNSELQAKVADLSRANNDMNNLLAGTGIATVFVDFALRILRFTPAASELINLIPSDVGRPVGHIVSNLVGYDTLVTDVQSVLDSLAPKEVEVESKGRRIFKMRIVPYRTLDHVIEGAVVTFLDITEIRQGQRGPHAPT